MDGVFSYAIDAGVFGAGEGLVVVVLEGGVCMITDIGVECDGLRGVYTIIYAHSQVVGIVGAYIGGLLVVVPGGVWEKGLTRAGGGILTMGV